MGRWRVLPRLTQAASPPRRPTGWAVRARRARPVAITAWMRLRRTLAPTAGRHAHEAALDRRRPAPSVPPPLARSGPRRPATLAPIVAASTTPSTPALARARSTPAAAPPLPSSPSGPTAPAPGRSLPGCSADAAPPHGAPRGGSPGIGCSGTAGTRSRPSSARRPPRAGLEPDARGTRGRAARASPRADGSRSRIPGTAQAGPLPPTAALRATP